MRPCLFGIHHQCNQSALDESLERFARRQILAVALPNRESQASWQEASRYLNMDLLKEGKKLRISLAA